MRSRLLLTSLLVAFNVHAARPYRGGVVASQHATASAAGKEMLEAGGNAVDAAVATAFTLAVVGPYHSGLGGGGFAIVHLAKENEDLAFDFREVAPAAASRDMYLREGVLVPDLSTDGARSVAVPGAVKGYLELQAKYGKLTRAKVLAPAIRAAKEGFFITPKYRTMATPRLECLKKDPEAARLFLKDGAVPEVGFKLTQADLAKTLELLSKSGDAPFYSGAIAAKLVETMQKNGGLVTAADLKAYTTRWRTPLTGSYRGHRIVTMPPPSAGGVVLLQTLGMIEALGALGPASHDPEVLHFTIEALRRSFVDRAEYLGDPAFAQVPVERLLSKPYLAQLLAGIDPKKATRSATLMPPSMKMASDGGTPAPKNTSHLSVVDRDGNAVSLTTTVNQSFGSCLVAKGTGIMLNDEMDDFAAQPGSANGFGLVQGEANAIAPGKVPLSSMTPTLVFQKEKPNDVMLVVGSPGGSTIPTTVLQVISGVIDNRADIGRAVAAGRLHHQWLPDEVWVERNGLEPATAAALTAMGHTLVTVESLGNSEAVLVDPVTGLKTSSSDPRNEGAPAGQE